jgi:hypothetical protein
MKRLTLGIVLFISSLAVPTETVAQGGCYCPVCYKVAYDKWHEAVAFRDSVRKWQLSAYTEQQRKFLWKLELECDELVSMWGYLYDALDPHTLYDEMRSQYLEWAWERCPPCWWGPQLASYPAVPYWLWPCGIEYHNPVFERLPPIKKQRKGPTP